MAKILYQVVCDGGQSSSHGGDDMCELYWSKEGAESRRDELQENYSDNGKTKYEVKTIKKLDDIVE